MEQYPPFFAQASDLSDRLNCPDFVVCSHYADEHGVVGDGFRQDACRNEAGPVHREAGYPHAFTFKLLAWIENCLVLNYRRDDMVPTATTCASGSQNGEVVAFRRPGREENLSCFAADECADLRPARSTALAASRP